MLEKYICIFFIYAFLGWCMETIGEFLKSGKTVNRGFLIGPYCPVYGIGVVLITIFLSKYVNDFLVMFIMSIVICGTLEYFTSYIMEKLFNARWWDYHNRKFNINGRICLETLIPFGLVGTILVKFVTPFFLGIIFKVPIGILDFILIILCTIILIDIIVSFNVILGFRKTTKQVEKEVKDNTEEVSKKVKEITTEKIREIKEFATKEIRYAKLSLENKNRILILNMKISQNKFKRRIKYTHKKILENITEGVKIRFIENSWLSQRLAKAFPNLEVKLKNKTKNRNK